MEKLAANKKCCAFVNNFNYKNNNIVSEYLYNLSNCRESRDKCENVERKHLLFNDPSFPIYWSVNAVNLVTIFHISWRKCRRKLLYVVKRLRKHAQIEAHINVKKRK